MPDRPLLYLDVDGVLNPYAAKRTRRPDGYVTHRLLPPSWIAQREEAGPPHRLKPLRVWLNPGHGPKLLTLAEHFELWWATTWEHEANTHIGPLIGLPELPVVEWQTRHQFSPEGLYFKTAELVEHAAGRPFVWLDDEIGDRDRAYVKCVHRAPVLLHWVDPAKGLLDDDFEALKAWAIGQGGMEGLAA